MIFLIFLLILFFSPYYVTCIAGYTSKNNELQVKALAETIVQNLSSNEKKARVLYEWFLPENGNMYNIYGKYLILELYPTDIFYPLYLCIRLEGHENPYWILTSRCGSCSEYSLFYRELSNYANLTVRSIHNPGEDHNWDEVFVNGAWMIVDPSMPLYNVSARYYEENRSLNMSYVYAEYSNGTREDVTYRYTSLSNLTITTLDVDGKIIPNVTISVYSDNYRPEMDTKLNCTTNNYGKCFFSIGSGKYTLKSVKEDGMLYNKTNFEIEENTSKNVGIILVADILDAPLNKSVSLFIGLITSIILVILLWIVIIIYINM